MPRYSTDQFSCGVIRWSKGHGVDIYISQPTLAVAHARHHLAFRHSINGQIRLCMPQVT